MKLQKSKWEYFIWQVLFIQMAVFSKKGMWDKTWKEWTLWTCGQRARSEQLKSLLILEKWNVSKSYMCIIGFQPSKRVILIEFQWKFKDSTGQHRTAQGAMALHQLLSWAKKQRCKRLKWNQPTISEMHLLQMSKIPGQGWKAGAVNRFTFSKLYLQHAILATFSCQ